MLLGVTGEKQKASMSEMKKNTCYMGLKLSLSFSGKNKDTESV